MKINLKFLIFLPLVISSKIAYTQTLDPLSAMRIHLPEASSNFDRANSGMGLPPPSLPPTYLPGKINNYNSTRTIDYGKFTNINPQQPLVQNSKPQLKVPIAVKNYGIFELNLEEIKKNK